MDNTIDVSSSSTLRIHKNHPQSQIIGPTASGVKTRKQLQEETKKITQALQDESWVEAMQEELLQFKLQNGIDREEGVSLDEVFAPILIIQTKSIRRGAIDKTLFIKRDRKDIMLVQVYVDDIILGSTKTSMVRNLKRSMIGCLMYLTASRPDIMFAVCLCARFQVTPKVSHMNAVKMIFSDFAGGIMIEDQLLVDQRHVVYGQVLDAKNQLFDYGFNFMNTNIHIDNESTICIVKNPVFHSKTKHIQIRHHFIRDCYDQRLINVPSEGNADFHYDIDFLTGCYVKYALLVIGCDSTVDSTILEYFAKGSSMEILVHTYFHGLALRNSRIASPFDVSRFIQLFLNKQLEISTKPQNFLPTVVLPPKVFTFMRKCSPKFFGKLTPLTPPMLEVATAVRAAHSLHTEEFNIIPSSHHSDDSSAGKKAENPSPVASERSASPNDYTLTDEDQTSGGDEGNLDKDKDPVKKLSCDSLETVLLSSLKLTLSKKKSYEGTSNENSLFFQTGRKKVSEEVLHYGANLRNEPFIEMKWKMKSGPSNLSRMSLMRKGIMKEEPKKKKLTLQQLRAAETANDEEVARKVVLAQRRFRARATSSILRRSKTSYISQLRNQMMKYIRNVGGKAYRNLKNKSYEEIKDIYEKVKRFNDKFVAIGSTEDEQAIKEMNVKAEEPSKKRKGTIRKMKSSRIIKKRKIQKSDDELKNFLKVVDFEGDSAQDVEVMEQRSLISRFSIVQSPEGEYIAVQRANGHIRAFNTLNEVLHILDRQDLHNLHRLVIEYYEHIPPTGLGLILHGDLTTMMETTEESDDELWRNQTEWEIIRWRLYESTGVHILELENGTMIHMLVEQRYPLTRELMQRMLEHKLEVQKETENALNVIRFVMKQKEDLEREEE
ncbi:hypothetical protein Tco_0565325 [Tanacetum coccineum]